MAEWTGLEPATPGVTGRYSNQLNYHSVLSNRLAFQPRRRIISISSLFVKSLCSKKLEKKSRSWWMLRVSNSRPTPCKGAALPTELSIRTSPSSRSEKREVTNCTGNFGRVGRRRKFFPTPVRIGPRPAVFAPRRTRRPRRRQSKASPPDAQNPPCGRVLRDYGIKRMLKKPSPTRPRSSGSRRRASSPLPLR